MLNRKERIEYVNKNAKAIEKYINNVDKECANEFNKELKKAKIEFKRSHKKHINDPDRIKVKRSTLTRLFELTKPKYIKADKNYLYKHYVKPKNCQHKEVVDGIDLSPYISKIRNRKKEYEVVLFIRNHKVIKEQIITTQKYGSVAGKGWLKEIPEEAKRLKADLYSLHNHPYSISAYPSFLDVKSAVKRESDLKKYGVKLLDMGVCTFDDYFSYKNMKRRRNKIMKQVKEDGIKDQLLKDLIQYAVDINTWEALNISRKKNHMYMFEYEKKMDLRKMPVDKFKNYERRAKKELKRIFKMYPECAF